MFSATAAMCFYVGLNAEGWRRAPGLVVGVLTIGAVVCCWIAKWRRA